MSIQSTAHARYDLWYHLAWATKYRKKVFTNLQTQASIEDLLRTIAVNYDITIDIIKCLPDHIHASLSAPPRIAPAQIVQILKSVSTKHMFQQLPWLESYYWGGEVWAGGYFVRSIGPGLTKEEIDAYILEQSEEL